MERGIMLIGGGVFLKGFDKFISKEIGFFVYIVERFFDCVVLGVGKVLEEIEILWNVMINRSLR